MAIPHQVRHRTGASLNPQLLNHTCAKETRPRLFPRIIAKVDRPVCPRSSRTAHLTLSHPSLNTLVYRDLPSRRRPKRQRGRGISIAANHMAHSTTIRLPGRLTNRTTTAPRASSHHWCTAPSRNRLPFQATERQRRNLMLRLRPYNTLTPRDPGNRPETACSETQLHRVGICSGQHSQDSHRAHPVECQMLLGPLPSRHRLRNPHNLLGRVNMALRRS